MATIRVLLQIEMVQPQVHPVTNDEWTPEELEAGYIKLIGDNVQALGGTLYVIRHSSYVETPDPPELPMEPDPVPAGPFDVAPESTG